METDTHSAHQHHQTPRATAGSCRGRHVVTRGSSLLQAPVLVGAVLMTHMFIKQGEQHALMYVSEEQARQDFHVREPSEWPEEGG